MKITDLLDQIVQMQSLAWQLHALLALSDKRDQRDGEMFLGYYFKNITNYDPKIIRETLKYYLTHSQMEYYKKLFTDEEN